MSVCREGSNNSFKPNLLRSTNNMAGKACHVVGSATQVGLTQMLGAMGKGSRTALKLVITSFLGAGLVAAFATTTPKPWTLTIIGIGLGCLSGHIRSRAISVGVTARMANRLGWLCGIGLMTLAMAFAENMFIGAWAASFFGYLLADRLYSLPASYRKERTAAGAVTDGT